MNDEELYKIALSNVPKYSLLNEILAIRDNRFPNEENDYTIKVYGSISLDVLNRYVRYIDRLVEYQNIGTIKNLKQLQNNWNELKKWLEEYQHKVLYEDVHKVIRDDSERYSFLFDLGHMNICEKTISVIRKKVRELEQGKDE